MNSIMGMHVLKVELPLTDQVECEKKAKKMILEIMPHWDINKVKFETMFNTYFSTSLKEQVDEIEHLVLQLNEDVVFCHNDLLVHNILFNVETEKVHFIDYEYADFNYAMFDLANHFCEYAVKYIYIYIYIYI
uniref:ethanolamine kinase n=1 Tax=Heterorhabditis bacteriophora TaxID=37862 RepID=A0A1I7X8F7_HETBA